VDGRHYYRRSPRSQRPSAVAILKGIGPHVKLVFTKIRRQRITYDEVEEGSGVLPTPSRSCRTDDEWPLSGGADGGPVGWHGSVGGRPLFTRAFSEADRQLTARSGRQICAAVRALCGSSR
jgi:hypothetical protein